MSPDAHSFTASPELALMSASERVRVSLVIHTRNEESNIAACIESARGLHDEIVVCDMYSEDRTRYIAESLGARVVMHEHLGDVIKARPFAIGQTWGEWIVVMDADERMTPALANELKTLFVRDYVEVIGVRWEFLFMGKYLLHGDWGSDQIRAFRRASYFKYIRPDDIRAHADWPGLRDCPGYVIAQSRLRHLAYPSLHKFTYKTLHKYSRLQAEDAFGRGERGSLRKVLTLPLKYFFRSYVLRQGYRDGLWGMIAALGMASYGFLVVANLYDLELGDLTGAGPEITWWHHG